MIRPNWGSGSGDEKKGTKKVEKAILSHQLNMEKIGQGRIE